MSKQTQMKKNIELSKKLMDFLVSHPDEREKLPNQVSFITYSEQDEYLNKENDKLIITLHKEGKKVVKAIQTNNPTSPWKFQAA